MFLFLWLPTMQTWVVSCSCSFAILIWVYFQVWVTLHQPWLPLTIHPIQDIWVIFEHFPCEIIHSGNWRILPLIQCFQSSSCQLFFLVSTFCFLQLFFFLIKKSPKKALGGGFSKMFVESLLRSWGQKWSNCCTILCCSAVGGSTKS